MKSLQEEASKYQESVKDKKHYGDMTDLDFIAGANSKWVQAEKIKAQMESLNKAKDLDILTVYNQLKEQLRQLECEDEK
jgi:hypothetical protein